MFILLCLTTWLKVNSQTLPPVPKRFTMFDLNVNLEENVRKTVEKEMAFLASKRVYVDSKLAKMAIYFPIIETIFDQENVPREFKYLCAQESSFIADAVSTSNAVGFWQFKAGTATDYGLRVDDMVDERKHIIASTRAAAKYLKNNNKTYQNWVSTLLSYRLGLTGAKNQVPSEWTAASEITITNSIDWYVIRNIAHFIYFENELAHFQPNGSYFYLYNNASGKPFSDIAQELQLNETELRKENLWCKTDVVPSDKDYTVLTLIKKDQKAPPVLAQQTTSNKPFFDIEVGYPVLKKDEKKSKKTGATFYTINGKDGILSIKGDSPQSLADRAGLKLQYLLSYNDLDKADAINPQMVYYLERKSRKADAARHTVKKGENTWLIAQMYGIKESRLFRMNRMKKNEALQEGRVLFLNERRGRKEEIEFVRKPFENEQLPIERPKVIIPDTKDTFPTKTNVPETVVDLTIKPDNQTTENNIAFETSNNTSDSKNQLKVIVRDLGDVKPTENTNVVYTKPAENKVNGSYIIVAEGDNLFSLAKKYNVTVTDLKAINGITTNIVNLGQKLIIPRSAKPSELTENKPIEKIENDNSKTNFHIVQPGETLYRLSVIHKVPVGKLKQINNLSDNAISVGQKIYISK